MMCILRAVLSDCICNQKKSCKTIATRVGGQLATKDKVRGWGQIVPSHACLAGTWHRFSSRAPAVSDLVRVEAHVDLVFIHRLAVGAEVHIGTAETPGVVQIVSERNHVGHANGHPCLLDNLEDWEILIVAGMVLGCIPCGSRSLNYASGLLTGGSTIWHAVMRAQDDHADSRAIPEHNHHLSCNCICQ